MDPDRRERIVAGALFFATCCSVYAVNLPRWSDEPLGSSPEPFTRSLQFTGVLMGILLAHELGHVLAAARHRFRIGLPWFLPAPFLVGTLGAIIVPREAPRDRDGLLVMGAAGPLAGLTAVTLALAVCLIRGFDEPVVGDPVLGQPLLFRLGGALAGVPAEVSVRDPVAFATWIGCLVTALNLLPFGQLDGGHVAAALWPDRASNLGWAVTALLMLAGLWWPGWALWAALLHVLGTRRALDVRNPQAPPTQASRRLALTAAGAWVLCVTPIPFAAG